MFDPLGDTQIVLPIFDIVSDLSSVSSLVKEKRLIAEIPSVIWEGSMAKVRQTVERLKGEGIEDFLCENIGALGLCSESGVNIHGGMYLNVLNSSSVLEYSKLGAKDLTVSFEMPVSKQKAMLNALKSHKHAELGILVYGYLPLMKFRACPAMGKDGCKGCTRDRYLKDRKGESFRILCHDSQYSELLNCVPLYTADKGMPDYDYYTLYFTVENSEECKEIYEMVRKRENPPFRRTTGLSNRELL